MDFSGALDVVVGLLFIFFVFSLVASGIYEAGARLLASRSRLLWSSLRQLLDDDSKLGDRRPAIGSDSAASLTDSLYAHPLIRQLEGRRITNLFQKTRLNHIPPSEFGRALVDVILPAGPDAITVDEMRAAIHQSESLPDPIKKSLLTVAGDATATIDDVRREIGEWFDTRMSAASRIYRRNTRWIMVVIGLVVVVSFNVDVIDAAQELNQDDTARQALAQQASDIVTACTRAAGAGQDSGGVDQGAISDCARQQIDEIEGGLSLPVGWTDGGDGVDGWTLLGWLLAAVAISQGAPFWFDLLRRVSGPRA